ncbi:MAG: hypothetical protein U0175_18320 [Caldilineaceae bacterium]
MHTFFKATFILLILLIPAAVVYADDTFSNIQSATMSAEPVNLALGSNTPVKFAQQVIKGSLPEWQRLAPTYADQSPLPVRGQAMYYNPGVMQKVITYRQRMHQIQDCADCIGYVALLRAGDINRKIWLQVSDDTVEGPYLVTDVAARHDIPRLLRLGWGIDVDWETAKRWNLHMPMVVIWDTPPAGMIVNSTAAWRATLAAAALQFNELQPWTPLQPAVKTVELVVDQVSSPIMKDVMNETLKIDMKALESAVNQTTALPLEHKGVVVNNMLFKPGDLKIRMERNN